MLDKTKTLGLSTRIVNDILADPARAEDFKELLSDTFEGFYNSGAAAAKTNITTTAKNFLLSKTFWGIAVSGGATVAGWFGHHIGSDQIVSYTSTIVGLMGSALALYGRYVAKEDLTWKMNNGVINENS